MDRGLETGLAGLDRSLVGYHTARDRAALPMYQFTCHLAQVDQPPDENMTALLTALRHNPADTSRFLGIMAGSVPITDFMDPSNLDRILAAAA